jgi:glycosyltransferase involved in cell wall biosynthesis
MISIIMCTFNDSHFLPKAISSCMEQDIEKEIILIDDASTKPFDPTAQLMIGQFGIKYFKKQKNEGLAAARNTGIEMAKYDWVIPLDADDWFYPNTIKTLYEAKEGYDIIGGSCTDVGNYIPAIAREPLTPALFKRENPMVCSSLFTKAIWKKAGGYLASQHTSYEDWNLWAKCFKAGAKFKYVPIIVYHHLSRADSMLRQLQPREAYFKKLATEGIFD